MEPRSEAKHVPAGQGRRIGMLGDPYTLVLTGADTRGALALVELRISPGNGTPPHIHHREDETFFVLDGRVTFFVAGRTVVAGPGDVVYGPRDVAHHYQNRESGPARMMVALTPAGFENFFVEVGEPLDGDGAGPRPPERADIQRILERAPRYGLEILPSDGAGAG